jgi:hypothetical protein
MIAVPSHEEEAKYLLSGDQANPETRSVCPVKVLSTALVSKFHTAIFLSSDATARNEPLGDHAASLLPQKEKKQDQA